MANNPNLPENALTRLRWPLRFTFAGMVAERGLRAYWPLISIVLTVLAALMFGLHENVTLELGWVVSVLAILSALIALVVGLKRFHWPKRDEALERLDRTLPGRPISAIRDTQVIGSGDRASEAVWQAHVDRMAAQTAEAKAVRPDLQIAKRDPFALRYVAVLAFVMALIFGSVWRVATVTDLVTGGSGVAGVATWEGWIEPPLYTGKPSIYLADISLDTLTVPMGSRVTLRLYGKIGDLTVAETVSGRTGDVESAADPNQSFDITRSGQLSIKGPGGKSWDIVVNEDAPPLIGLTGEVERGVRGDMRQPFEVADDFGVVAGRAELALDLAAVDRRFGLQVMPEPQEVISLDLPMPFSGDRREFAETLIENLAEHPWAGLPVTITLFASDALEQEGSSTPETITLPGRRFFDPLAAALVEQRRDLLWSRENAPRVAQVLRAVSFRPDGLFRSETAYLKLRVAIRRLELAYSYGALTDEKQAEIAKVLWDIAALIEDGNLSDAAERLRRAEERLEQAMRDGATDEEIAELMQELREAMQDYMQQLAQNAEENNEFAQSGEMQEITSDRLQELMDRLQELMEQGRMEEAAQLMEQLRRMMENMQVTQGEQGQGQQSEDQQAMQGLADTLRQQQGLSDDTFSDLQDQFGEDGEQPGEQGQQGEQGQGGQQGREGLKGEQGQGSQRGDGQGQGQGQDPGQALANRQQALRDMLEQQQNNLPGQGSPGGDAARDALGRAGRAMDGAEEALRQDDYASALDDQAEALEALREGMRDLAEEMARNQQQQQDGRQGEAIGQNESDNQRDPLGRDQGTSGRVGSEENLMQGDDVYRRAKELLDDIRRRSAEQERPQVERDYLKRLLDRF